MCWRWFVNGLLGIQDVLNRNQTWLASQTERHVF